jgi:quercetin dioxygenase-like cupin family protein
MQNSQDFKKNIQNNKIDQLVNFVSKVWGHEEWIVNNSKYCGKKLVLKKGFRCSMHKHNIKDETFYILSGLVLMEFEFNGKYEKRVMSSGDIMHIEIGMWHRFTGLQDSEIMEFSTFHMDEDSIRREDSGAVDLKSIGF